jgi:hypothetical protein
MSKQSHQKHEERQPHHSHGAPQKKIHHDWRFWGVILMLAGMVFYVLTMDEAFWPGGGDGQEVPAAE